MKKSAKVQRKSAKIKIQRKRGKIPIIGASAKLVYVNYFFLWIINPDKTMQDKKILT